MAVRIPIQDRVGTHACADTTAASLGGLGKARVNISKPFQEVQLLLGIAGLDTLLQQVLNWVQDVHGRKVGILVCIIAKIH